MALSLRLSQHSMFRSACGLLAAALAIVIGPVGRAAPVEIVDVRKIWAEGAHNAFTDLVWWQDQWWCTFREAEGHVGGDGVIRILVSRDGAAWTSAAALSEKGVDLRDPKFSVTPDGRLMLNCGGSLYEGKTLKGRRSRVMFSQDGRTWTPPQKILSEGEWCWRVTWYEGVAYSAVYRSTGPNSPSGSEWALVLYRSKDGVSWDLVKVLELKGRPNETTLRFTTDGEMIALVRREADGMMGYVGRSKSPFTDWSWQASNYRFGGQNVIQIPDGRWIVGTRDYTGTKQGSFAGARMILAELEPAGHLRPLVTLPSNGDASYPGLVWRDGQLAVSYYSSHEGKTSIYFARVKL